MELKEIARQLQGKAANLALRMPISWVNILAGAPITVDGRTLDAAPNGSCSCWRTAASSRCIELGVPRRAPSSTSSSRDVGPAGADRRDRRPHHRRSRWPDARAPLRPAGSVARLLPTDPLLPWRRLGDRQPRGL
jgi:acetyl esterase